MITVQQIEDKKEHLLGLFEKLAEDMNFKRHKFSMIGDNEDDSVYKEACEDLTRFLKEMEVRLDNIQFGLLELDQMKLKMKGEQ